MRQNSMKIWLCAVFAVLFWIGVNAAASADGEYSIQALDENTCAVTGYTGAGVNAVIPSVLEGLTVRRIGEGAFRGNADIQTVTIPDTVTDISRDAFNGCSSLVSVEFGGGLATIGDSAFYNCTSLEAVSFPESLRSIGPYAFYNCASIENTVFQEGLESIGPLAFFQCYSLGSVSIPDTVTAIESGAFFSCTSLTFLDLGDGIESIGSSAFYGCAMLTDVTFPDGLQSIGEGAFSNVPLQKIILPDSVTHVGYGAFLTSSLKEVRWTGGIESVPAELFSHSPVEKAVIPEGVTALGSNVFSFCEHLTDVSLPSTLLTVGGQCFRACSALETVYLPAGLTGIPNEMFYECPALQNIVIPDSATEIGQSAFQSCISLSSVEFGSGLATIGDSAFYNCTSLEAVSFPASLRSIGSHAFYGCESIGSAVFQEGLESIGPCAFYQCCSLGSVSIPDTVTLIEGSAFHGCSSLASLSLGSGVERINNWAFSECGMLTDVTFPDSLQYIESSSFQSTPLQRIILPDSVTHVGDGAFQMSAVKEARWSAGMETVPASFFRESPVEKIVIPEGVTALGDGAFMYCAHLKDVSLPSTLLTAGAYCFRGCTSLETISLPAGLTAVAQYMFYECHALRNIVIPDSVTEIGECAFTYCVSLASAQFGNGLEAIERAAFSECASLQAVSLPESLQTLGVYAFDGCSALADVTLPGTLETIEDGAFEDCVSLESIAIPDSVKQIDPSAFTRCSSLTQVHLSSSLKTIGDSAFRDCARLEEIEFPEGLTRIEGCAFHDTPLRSVQLPDSVTYLGDSVFQPDQIREFRWPTGIPTVIDNFFHESSVQKVVLPEGVTGIGGGSFFRCGNLTEIELPESLETIGGYAFYSCGGPSSLIIPSSVNSIGEGAFSYASMTLRVYRGTYAETYAIANSDLKFAYQLNAYNSLKVLPQTVSPLENYAGSKLWLYVDGKPASVITLMGRRASYEFSIREPGEDYAVVLFSAWGDELARAEHIPLILTDARQKKENICELNVSVGMAAASVRLLDSDGRDVTDKASIRWYIGDEVVYTGKQLPSQPVGKTLRMEAILSQSLGVAYQEPAAQTVTIHEGENVTALSLTPLPRLTVTGRAVSLEDGSAVKGAVLSVSQTVNGRFACATQAKTNDAGEYAFEIVDAPYTLIARKTGYEDYQGLPQQQLIRLQPLAAARVTLDLSYFACGNTGSEAGDLNAGDLRVKAAEAAGGAGKKAVLQYPEVLLPQCAAGDTLRFTLSSAGNDFAPVEVTLTLDEEGENNRIAASLVQYGGVTVTAENNQNTNTLFALYDGQGKFVASSETEDKSATFRNLEAGSYTALIMGARSRFHAPAALELMAGMGLTENEDYILQAVQVSDGVIASASVSAAVPALNGELFSYIQDSAVHSNRQSMVAGNYVTIRATASLIPEGAEAHDFTWLISVPENNRYVENTAMVGKTSVDCVLNGEGLLEIPASSLLDTMRLCFAPVEEGSYEVQVYLRFILNDRLVLQPVGSVRYEAKGLTLNVPGSVDSGDVTLRGTAAMRAMVYIYEGDTLLGQTQANAGGDWSATVSLDVNGYASYHYIHVEAQNETDPDLLIISPTAMVRYSPNAIVLRTVTMVNTAHPATDLTPTEFETVFDYTGEDRSVAYYRYMPGFPDFTFIVRFNVNDPERITAVRLGVKLTSGATEYFDAVYSAAQDGWVAKGTFSDSSALPFQVGVLYHGDKETVAPGEEDLWPVSVIDEETASAQVNEPDADDPLVFTTTYQGVTMQTDTITLDFLSPAEWEAELAKDAFTFYKAENGYTMYTSTVTTGGGVTVEVATVGETGAFIHREAVESCLLEMFEDYLAIVKSQDFQQMMYLIEQDMSEYHRAYIDNMPLLAHRGAEVDYPPNTFYNNCREQLAIVEEHWQNTPVYHVISDIEAFLPAVSYVTGFDIPSGITTLTDYLSYKALSDAQNLDLMFAKIPLADKIRMQTASSAASASGVLFGFLSSTGQLITDMERAALLGLADGAWMWAEYDLEREQARERYYKEHDSGINFDEIERMNHSMFEEPPADVALKEARDAMKEKINKELDEQQDALKRFANLPKTWMDGIDDELYYHKYGHWPDPDSRKKPPEMDPSGVVYEAVPGNVLEGVKATCMQLVTEYDIYGDPYTYEKEWDAREFDQINPQLTDTNGFYGWDVPDGLWRVRYEKDGYETAYSEWLVVPPPQVDVNVGLVSYDAPAVKQALVYADRVDITFTKYMRAASVGDNMALVTVNGIAVDGEWVFPGAEPDPHNAEEMLGVRMVFCPAQAIPADAEVGIELSRQIESYAGVAMQEAYSQVFPVIPAVESLSVQEEVTLDCEEETEIALQAFPANVAAGLRVTVSTASAHVAQAREETVILDSQGSATAHIIGAGPGSTQVLFSIEGTEITASLKVTVNMPQAVTLQVQTPSASEENGASLPYGTEITLSSATPNARIYYILDYADGTAEPRTLYTGPIALYQDVTLYAVGEKTSMDSSEVASYTYTVYGQPAFETEVTFPWAAWCGHYAAPELPAAGESGYWITTNAAVAAMENGSLIIRGPGEAKVQAIDGVATSASIVVHVEEMSAGLNLPGALVEIDDQAFFGIRSFAAVKLPETLRSIGAEAFRSCGRLRLVYIPSSVTAIGDDAFADCSRNLFILGHADSAAEAYAESHGIPFLTLQ